MSTPDPQDPVMTRDENALGPDEGGLMGENTPFAGGWDRRPSEEGMRIDAAIQSATDTNAGPNSDATTLIDDPQASRDNQA
jgi:hypothetical protein